MDTRSEDISKNFKPFLISGDAELWFVHLAARPQVEYAKNRNNYRIFMYFIFPKWQFPYGIFLSGKFQISQAAT